MTVGFCEWSSEQFSACLRPEVQGGRKDTRRRSEEMGVGKDKFLGGSDPTLSGLAAAQRHGRRGSLPPKWLSRVSRSVVGRVVGEAVRTSESH